MIANEKKSIIIDFKDLYSYDENLANLVLTYPYDYLPHLDYASFLILKNMYPNYATYIQRMHVRFRNLPLMTLIKHLGVKHIGRLIMVQGSIVRIAAVHPSITISAHCCATCGEIIYQKQSGRFIKPPFTCPSCKAQYFNLLLKESDFVNSQMITIQQFSHPKSIQLNVELRDDIVDIASIGNEVYIIGCLKMIKRHERRFVHRVFDLFIEANNIEIIKTRSIM